MNTNASNFIARLPDGTPANIAEKITVAFGIADRFSARAADVRKDPTLTRQGQADRLKSVMASGFGEHLAQLRKEISTAIAGVNGEVDRLRARALENKFDGALKAEVRAFLRGLPDAERRRLVLEGDELIAVSVLEAPHYLSNIHPDVWAHVERRRVETKFGQRLDAMQREDQAFQIALSAVEVVKGQLMRDAEMDEATFSAIAA